MTNRGRLSFNQTEEIILLPTTVNINKYYTANILYFSEVTNIKRVHIKMDTSKEKLINVYIKDGKIVHLKACVGGLFYTNLDDPSMITNPNNFSINAYSYLSNLKQNSIFFTDS